ncbi:MAG: FIST N-terminal domain-containing protein [Actinomycetota bacterium]
MRIGSGLSTHLDPLRAAEEAVAEVAAGVIPGEASVVLAFVSSDHRDAAEDIAGVLRDCFGRAEIAGCVAEGIIGGARELEHGPAVSVWAADLPGTRVEAFALEFDDENASYSGWPRELPFGSTLILMSDPFTFPVVHLLAQLNEQQPGVQVIGGVVSGVHEERQVRMFLGGEVRARGAVGIAVSGQARVGTLVSQGCRAIGEPMIITRADRNLIFELGGQRPVDRIRDIWSKVEPAERALMANGPLFIGRVVDEYKTDFGRGDFVVRNVMGADAEKGFIVVADVVEVGETIQFHVRDPRAADEDLRQMLGSVSSPTSGALLFTCNGRGSNMFEEQDHDAAAVHKGLGEVPLAGFFANGEIGPLSGQNFLHGHTASLAIFGP